MLVRAFQVKFGRRYGFRPRTDQAMMHHARVHPDIDDIAHLHVVIRIFTQQFLDIQIEPGVHAILFDQRGHLGNQDRTVRMQFIGVFVDKKGNRHAPGPLPGNAPVRPPVHHAHDPGFAPVGYPLHFADLGKSLLAQTGLVHADEPLGRRAKNQRRFVAPAMRVTVLDRFTAQQYIFFCQQIDDEIVGLEYMLPFDQRRAGDKTAVAANRIFHRQIVLDTGGKVFLTMARRGVNGAGARLDGDIVPGDHRDLAIIEGMLQ
ncbi:hypothetical protein MnTg04_01497 [bacterium MnTg04]|nr:hypothetical protein MnTg04_01497 [bacterium MnTg04]